MEIDWKLLKMLQVLYEFGSVKGNIEPYKYKADLTQTDHAYIRIVGNQITTSRHYASWYERYWLEKIANYELFLQNQHIISLADGFTIEDMDSLKRIEADKENAKNLTRKKLTATYFKNQDEKYIKKNSNKEKAIKAILAIPFFPEDIKDQQFLWVLHAAHAPNYILLCENENQLIEPRLPYTEVWYAGGKNTAKLAFIPKPNLPVYYLCDWDQDGLSIYISIKTKYLTELTLVFPENYLKIAKSIVDSKHQSLWKSLEMTFFNAKEREVILFLRENNLWITEQTIPLPERFSKK